MPAPFAEVLRDEATRAGAALIVDEVQTGLGRTGTLWGLDPLGVAPDVMVLSKAIGGGLPLSVIVYRAELDGWPPGAHAGTFRGNQLAMAAGAATIGHVVDHELAGRAAVRGGELLDGLAAVTAGHEVVGEVRGRGLMAGVELVDPTDVDRLGRPRPDGALAGAVQAALLERGVLAEVGGRDGSVVRFLPPLIITATQIEQVVQHVGDALTAVTSARAAR